MIRFTQDVRYAFRQLRNSPGFTLVAILRLPLGICSSIGIFAFVDAALIKPLPYQDSSQLVALLALLLGAIGLYGVVAYSVTQRAREIGVRMALGAQRSSVYSLVLKEAAWLVSFCILAGIVFSLAVSRLMQTLLFGVRAWDVPTLAGVAAVLAVWAFLASYLPARRAAKVDPIVALRYE